MTDTIHAATQRRPTLFLIDEDEQTRRALQNIAHLVKVDVVPFSSPLQFIGQVSAQTHGCIVLETRLPSMSGLHFARQLRATGNFMPVIFLTAYADVRTAVRALKDGAFEFLTKPGRQADIMTAVQAGIEQDEQRLSQLHTQTTLHARFKALSAREREVLILVTAGQTNRQIADRLGLSVVTVKFHRARLMEKMRARSFLDLVRSADAMLGAQFIADYLENSPQPSPPEV